MLQITDKAVHKILNLDYTKEEEKEMEYNEEYRPVYNGVVFEPHYDDNGNIQDVELSWKVYHWEKATIDAKDLKGKSDQEIADMLNAYFAKKRDCFTEDTFSFWPTALEKLWKEGLPAPEDWELPF